MCLLEALEGGAAVEPAHTAEATLEVDRVFAWKEVSHGPGLSVGRKSKTGRIRT
jgi:hypothetical protein